MYVLMVIGQGGFTKMSNYWNNREIKQREYLLNKAINELMDELGRCYRKSMDRIINEMAILYDEITTAAQGQVLVSHLYQYNRYYELLNNMNAELRRLGLQEVSYFRNQLQKVYIDNQAIINASFNLSSEINYEAVEDAINDAWVNDGQIWSDRIWNNKDKLSEKLREGLVDCLASGASTQKLTKNLMNDFGVSFHNAHTLARTELAHIQNVSTLDKYKQAGVKEVRVLVDPDCCEDCNSHKNTVFDINSAPVLPEHPNCRCTYLAVIPVNKQPIHSVNIKGD